MYRTPDGFKVAFGHKKHLDREQVERLGDLILRQIGSMGRKDNRTRAPLDGNQAIGLKKLDRKFTEKLGIEQSQHLLSGPVGKLLLSRERAIELWEASSCLKADPAALHWWEVFSGVKGLAIWISSGREYLEGPNRDPILGFTSWWLPNSQDRAILETLGRL